MLFGSQVDGFIHPNSDFDIGVVFENENIKKQKPVNVYGDLYEVFSKTFKIKNPDIVYLEDAPLSLQFKAINKGKVMYFSSPKFLADYKEKIMIKYFDFSAVEEYFKRIFLNRRKKYDTIRSIGY